MTVETILDNKILVELRNKNIISSQEVVIQVGDLFYSKNILTNEKSSISNATQKESPTNVSVDLNTLYIEYKLDSWTEIIDSSGNIVFFDLVKKNKSIKINISAPFEILLGDATAPIIKYNNKIIDVPYFNPDTKVVKFKIE